MLCTSAGLLGMWLDSSLLAPPAEGSDSSPRLHSAYGEETEEGAAYEGKLAPKTALVPQEISIVMERWGEMTVL